MLVPPDCRGRPSATIAPLVSVRLCSSSTAAALAWALTHDAAGAPAAYPAQDLALLLPTLAPTAGCGISSLQDIADLYALVQQGLEGAILGKSLYAGRFTLEEALAVANGKAL